MSDEPPSRVHVQRVHPEAGGDGKRPIVKVSREELRKVYGEASFTPWWHPPMALPPYDIKVGLSDNDTSGEKAPS